MGLHPRGQNLIESILVSSTEIRRAGHEGYVTKLITIGVICSPESYLAHLHLSHSSLFSHHPAWP